MAICHVDLIKSVIDVDKLYVTLANNGYKGNKSKMLEHLLYAVKDTDLYILPPRNIFIRDSFKEKDYFDVLIKKMNSYV